MICILFITLESISPRVETKIISLFGI